MIVHVTVNGGFTGLTQDTKPNIKTYTVNSAVQHSASASDPDDFITDRSSRFGGWIPKIKTTIIKEERCIRRGGL